MRAATSATAPIDQAANSNQGDRVEPHAVTRGNPEDCSSIPTGSEHVRVDAEGVAGFGLGPERAYQLGKFVRAGFAGLHACHAHHPFCCDLSVDRTSVAGEQRDGSGRSNPVRRSITWQGPAL